MSTNNPDDEENTEARLCNGTAMRKASRKLTQLYDEALAPCGIRSTQFAVLAELNRSPKTPTLQELASALVMDRSALGHLLKPLERDGFIAIKEDAEDRRRHIIVMTKKGIAKFKACLPLWQRAQDKVSEVVGKSESIKLRLALLRIAHNDRLNSID